MARSAPNEIKHWVLLRGLSREQRHWGEFLRQLERAAPQRQFHCIDLPGTGDNFQDVSPGSVAGIRSHLQTQYRELGVTGPIGIIGLSLGGMLALDWMAVSGEVAAVVVINTSCRQCPLRQRLTLRALILALKILLSRDEERREQLVLQMVSRRHSNNREMIKRWASIQRDRPVTWDTVRRQLKAAAAFDLPDSHFDTPGLVLFSRADQMVSFHCSEYIAGFYGWLSRAHDSAGHDIPLDDPRWVVEKIIGWWEATSH